MKYIYLSGLLIIAIIIMLINPFSKSLDTYTDKTCYEQTCKKYNLEEFDKCIDIGYEDCGILCNNHYWLCDGEKISKRCIDYGWVETNRTIISYGMKCEEDAKDNNEVQENDD